MLRSVATKVAWVGRTAAMVFGLALVMALVIGAASTAWSATGGNFILGKGNSATTASRLTASIAGPALKLVNQSTDAAATALNISVASGNAPLKVNAAAGTATDLSADELDGRDSSEFATGTNGQADDSSHADLADTATNAGNADTVDGKHATDFYAAGSKVDDSSHADTADSATNADLATNATNADNADNADLLDDKDSSDFAAAYESTVVVSPVGTDTENGTALLVALSGITDASATKKYLLHIEPGTYDLGNGSLQMEEYVDIEGSGELNTLITTTVTNDECTQDATLYGADYAELRFLAVVTRATSHAQCTVAIFNDSASPRLTNVTASTEGTNLQENNTGVYNVSSSPIMTNVTATGSGGSTASMNTYTGVFNTQSSSPIMTNVTATGASEGTGATIRGVVSYSSSPTIKQSTLIGTEHSLLHDDGTAKVADTQLVGPVSDFSENGTLRCFGNYDGNLAAVNCP